MHARYVVKDTFYKKAKKEGYRARSAYKLEEIQKKFNVIKKGDRVLDLGAAPGSWLQVEAALVGESGRVVGLDILPLQPLSSKAVMVRMADVRETDMAQLLDELDIPYFDVITCDIAPNLSGIREADNAHIRDIFLSVKRVVQEGLKKGGTFVIKAFFGEEFKELQADLTALFSRVVTFKPQASRGVSAEVYFVCLGRK